MDYWEFPRGCDGQVSQKKEDNFVNNNGMLGLDKFISALELGGATFNLILLNSLHLESSVRCYRKTLEAELKVVLQTSNAITPSLLVSHFA